MQSFRPGFLTFVRIAQITERRHLSRDPFDIKDKLPTPTPGGVLDKLGEEEKSHNFETKNYETKTGVTFIFCFTRSLTNAIAVLGWVDWETFIDEYFLNDKHGVDKCVMIIIAYEK